LINTGKFKASDITIFDPQQMHHYQPGYTNIAGGVWKTTHRDIMRDRESLLNPGLNWVREAVAYLEPSNNLVKTAEGNTHTYDYLVVASGLQLRYDLIKGAREALEDPECPVGSMYTLEFAQKMSQLRERYTGGKAIFTVPVMPIKCGGAP
jgi:NADH dehydrogenase FAD-containing subunit